MITASHNPDPWNGLKFIDREGLFLSPFRAQNLLDIYHQQSFLNPKDNSFCQLVEDDKAFLDHAQAVFKLVNTEKIRARRFRVFCDPGGGVGALYSRLFLEELACRVNMINDKTSASFPRQPDPLPENLAQAEAAMAGGDYQVGFAQDTDGDRLMVLDEKGVPLGGEKTLALALDSYLAGKRGGKVVVNLSTSRLSEWVSRRHGCEILRAPVGEINVSRLMLREGAIAGGEGNGGIIIPAFHPCRDSFVGIALILDALSRTDRPVSSLVGDFPDFLTRSCKIPVSGSGAYRIISELKRRYPDGDIRDGLRVDREKHWFHVRASNTEPVIRVIAEGEDQGFLREYEKLVAEIEQMS